MIPNSRLYSLWEYNICTESLLWVNLIQLKSLLNEILNISPGNGFNYLCCHFYFLNNPHKKVKFQKHYKILNPKMKIYLGTAWRVNVRYLQEILEWLHLLFSLNYDNVFQETLRQKTVSHFLWEKCSFILMVFQPNLSSKEHFAFKYSSWLFPLKNAKNGVKQERIIISALTIIPSPYTTKYVRKGRTSSSKTHTEIEQTIMKNNTHKASFFFSESGSH